MQRKENLNMTEIFIYAAARYKLYSLVFLIILSLLLFWAVHFSERELEHALTYVPVHGLIIGVLQSERGGIKACFYNKSKVIFIRSAAALLMRTKQVPKENSVWFLTHDQIEIYTSFTTEDPFTCMNIFSTIQHLHLMCPYNLCLELFPVIWASL